jgi:hypothetical protein
MDWENLDPHLKAFVAAVTDRLVTGECPCAPLVVRWHTEEIDEQGECEWYFTFTPQDNILEAKEEGGEDHTVYAVFELNVKGLIEIFSSVEVCEIHFNAMHSCNINHCGTHLIIQGKYSGTPIFAEIHAESHDDDSPAILIGRGGTFEPLHPEYGENDCGEEDEEDDFNDSYFDDDEEDELFG